MPKRKPFSARTVSHHYNQKAHPNERSQTLSYTLPVKTALFTGFFVSLLDQL